MALGAIYQLMRGELGGGPGERTAEEAYLDYRRNRAVPTLSSGEVRQVADWLTAELGRPVASRRCPTATGSSAPTRADWPGPRPGR